MNPIIVTRPAAAGQRLSERLARAGHDVAWWPAFDIRPPRDVEAVRARLRRLAEYDLALFVSANAVHGVAPLLETAWPASAVIGAVGAATRDAALDELRGAREAVMVAPDADEDSGSEAFWRAWAAAGRSARRVLLLRAESGRDWIAEQFRRSGADVEPLVVYRRLPRELGTAERARLAGWVTAGTAPVILVSSSEAVDAVLHQISAVDAAGNFLRAGIAIATHPRVAQRLHSDGFQHIETCDADDDAVVRKLESIAHRGA